MWQLNARAVAHFMMKYEIFIRECMDAHGEPGPQSEASDEPVGGCILYSIMALPEIAKQIMQSSMTVPSNLLYKEEPPIIGYK